MPLHDQFVQVIALLGVEAAEAEIVEDDQIWREVAAEDAPKSPPTSNRSSRTLSP
jgi:hypothetical protein